ncbi:MAG: hypothetical protein SNJ81_17655, partial [Cyanobacteriota bacterium]
PSKKSGPGVPIRVAINCLPNELEQREKVRRRERNFVLPDQEFQSFFGVLFHSSESFSEGSLEVRKREQGVQPC